MVARPRHLVLVGLTLKSGKIFNQSTKIIMKKIFSILAIAAAMVACSKEDATTDIASATYTLTGYSSNDTRTEFGTPEGSQIPFLWSEGDKILVLNQGGATVTEGEISTGVGTPSATFGLNSAPENGNIVYYNLNAVKGGFLFTAAEAKTAKVPATQSTANTLGENGDFGYAVVEDGAFTLNHATAYLWFNTTTSIENATLNSISVNADGVNIAGNAMWNNSEFGEVSEGKSEVTLTVNQALSSTNDNVWAMVVLPADLTGKSVNVIYELTVDGKTKHFAQTLLGKELTAGATQKITANIEETELYELRVLTFEDGTEGWEPYDCEFSYAMSSCEETKWVEKWSDYIPRDGQYGNGHASYEWYDEGNTELAFVKPEIETWWGISGHAGISDYVGTDEDADQYEDDNYLFMIDLQAYNVEGGANGSKNFCSQYGYLDPDEYATQYSPKGVLPGLQFMDEEPRVIDHMYVTNTTYAYTIIVNGECDFGGSYEYTDESTFKIVAYGYDSFDDTEPTTTEFYLLNTGKRIVTDWTKWDLSVLGKVVRVEFNLVACYKGYGRYGLVIPAYFAYDDVAVRF